jgi:hypothetical protein
VKATGSVSQSKLGREWKPKPERQCRKFEFVLILKTAKALGFTIPPSVLAITRWDTGIFFEP